MREGLARTRYGVCTVVLWGRFHAYIYGLTHIYVCVCAKVHIYIHIYTELKALGLGLYTARVVYISNT